MYDRISIGRILFYALLIILSIAVVVGAAALIMHLIDLGLESSEDDTQNTGPLKTEPSDTKKNDPPKTEPSDTEPPETEPVTETPETEPPETDAHSVTVYEEPKTMYALYNINARMRDTTNSDIIGMIYQSESVTVTGETDSGWYQVKYRGYTAYVRNDLLSSDPGEAAVDIEEYDTAKTMYTQARVNVREGYSTNTAIIATVDKGTEIKVTGKTGNGWYRVKFNGTDAYISSDYLRETMPTEDDAANE